MVPSWANEPFDYVRVVYIFFVRPIFASFLRELYAWLYDAVRLQHGFEGMNEERFHFLLVNCSLECGDEWNIRKEGNNWYD